VTANEETTTKAKRMIGWETLPVYKETATKSHLNKNRIKFSQQRAKGLHNQTRINRELIVEEHLVDSITKMV